jgi:monoamine oxidase
MDRREFLRLAALSGLAFTLGARRSLLFAGDPPPNPFSGKWMGEDFAAGHALRDGELPDFKNAETLPTADVLVVGGGISGLVAARALAKAGRTVRVLEQDARPGGNAKSADWGGLAYSIGAAYFCAAEEGSELDELYRGIGVMDKAKKVPKGEVFLGGKLLEEFWEGGTDEANAEATKRVREELRKYYETRYPAIPYDAETGWTGEDFRETDSQTFAAWLDSVKAPPHVRRFCEHYFWSSFGGSPSEISAYAGLNFVTAEFGDIYALPGGNGAIAGAIVAGFDPKQVTVDTGVLAAEVRSSADGVSVRAVSGGKPRAYSARAAVLAIPRFVVPRIVPDFPKVRAAAIKAMKWRAYVVANVLLRRRPAREWYDAYTLEALDSKTCGWTDLILADFVADPKSDRSVLTAYRALPFEKGREQILLADQFGPFAEAVRRDLAPVLPALGLAPADIVDVNLARWGHPLVQALPGQLSSKEFSAISEPLGRLAFAHQDRYGTPAIETAAEAGFRAAEEVEELLKG